jgi:antitoxin ParD1/3/4
MEYLHCYQFLVILKKKKNNKMRNTSISLGNYFDQFVGSQVSGGRYKNVSEVIRAGLRLLEDEESKIIVLRNAIQEGIDSGIVQDFDPKKHLQELKMRRTNDGKL